ncbi:TnsD family Tn7-like transposition protein [Paenibacillus lautus]|uniref:TnsD family Tn7-like transposition protein n=1 Tax=Paenibacillus lautus TaxID=1401 RepID=UPI001C119833|nr:TnsD family Tn7-like transposition protein [Paenibacillus lautus]MBU5349135.1 TnsD family transposase [Paenibacillus lautus]
MRAYPDELLVSIVARYHHLNGHKGIKPTRRNIYGLEYKKTSIDLPTTIRPILNIIHSYDDELLQSNTLFPFYRPFLSERQVESIKRQMLDGHGGTVHLTSGLMASVVKVSEFLRLCPCCLKEDSQLYGEPYWHREHQLPGNLLCPTHKCELLARCLICNEPVSANNTKDLSICPLFCKHGHDLSAQTVKSKNGTLLKVSKGIVTLFKASLEGKVPSDLRSLYANRLGQMNLCTVGGRIKQREVCSQFQSMFSSDFLTKIGVPAPIGSDNWLSTILRKPRRSFHPLLHALVIEFLWGGTNGISSSAAPAPFCDGPWPCLNKIAGHYKQHTITEVTVTRCTNTNKPVGSFKCELCGFHYSRRGPDLLIEDTYSYGRVKDFGHYWKAKADSLIQKGGSIRSIARALEVESKTVKLYMKKKQEQQAVDSLQMNEERDIRRIRLLQNINDFQSYKCFRKANAKDYSWLYRHDREWLLSSLPSLAKQPKSKPRVNWNERDKEIAQEINQAILKLLMGQHKPERITLFKIGRSIGKLALLERHMDKLPICQELLKISLETEEQHQIRKIDWGINRIKQQGKRPVKWRILREAGIRVFKSEYVEQYLISKMQEALYKFQDTISA